MFKVCTHEWLHRTGYLRSWRRLLANSECERIPRKPPPPSLRCEHSWRFGKRTQWFRLERQCEQSRWEPFAGALLSGQDRRLSVPAEIRRCTVSFCHPASLPCVQSEREPRTNREWWTDWRHWSSRDVRAGWHEMSCVSVEPRACR